MSNPSQRMASGLQRMHGYFAFAIAVVLVVVGVVDLGAHRVFGIGALSFAPLMAALGVLVLDAAAANEAARRTPGIQPDPDGRRRPVTLGAAAGAVLGGIGGGVDVVLGGRGFGSVIVGAAVVVLLCAFLLPAFVRTRVAPVVDPADEQRSGFAKRRQFGRPRAALGFGVVIVLLGVASIVLSASDHGETNLRLVITGPLLVVGGVIVIVLAIRQLRTK